MATDGRWVAYCAPAANGQSPLTLAWADGHSENVALVLGQSFDGRAAAFAVGDTWQLMAMDSGRRFDLTERGIDRRFVVNARDARSIVFHPALPLVALLLRHDGKPSVTVLDYENATETRITPASLEVFRLAWDPSGEYLLLDEIPEDTNRNRTLDWPIPEAKSPPLPCNTGVARFVANSTRGDRVLPTAAPRSGGTAVAVNGAWLYDGRHWLGVTDTHAAVAFEPNRQRHITPDECEARPIAAHGATKQLLVGCVEKGRMALGLVTSQQFRPLGIDMPLAGDFERHGWPERLLPIYSGTRSTLVDFERQSIVTLNERDQLLAQAGETVVLRRGTSLVRRGLTDASEAILAGDVAPGARVILGRRVAWVDPYVVDAGSRALPYVVPRVVAALSENGCALSYTRVAEPPGYACGPLRWACGTPSADDKAQTSAVTVEKRASGSIANACSTQASTSAGKS